MNEFLENHGIINEIKNENDDVKLTRLVNFFILSPIYITLKTLDWAATFRKYTAAPSNWLQY